MDAFLLRSHHPSMALLYQRSCVWTTIPACALSL
jgi:hypothetical protein